MVTLTRSLRIPTLSICQLQQAGLHFSLILRGLSTTWRTSDKHQFMDRAIEVPTLRRTIWASVQMRMPSVLQQTSTLLQLIIMRLLTMEVQQDHLQYMRRQVSWASHRLTLELHQFTILKWEGTITSEPTTCRVQNTHQARSRVQNILEPSSLTARYTTSNLAD
jgi:hypothetical protein